MSSSTKKARQISQNVEPPVKKEISYYEETVELKSKLNTHKQTLKLGEVRIVVSILVMIAIIVMCDTIGISMAIPSISHSLNAERSIQWTGTVFSISNSVITVLSGRFSDIFGRKPLLLGCLAISGIFGLAQGFAKTATQFYIFRAIAGLGAGGVIPLCMVVIADVVTPEDRAKYQGMLGSGVGTGSCLGYLLFAGMVQSTKRGWRNGFYLLSPLWGVAFAVVFWFVPHSTSKLNRWEIVRNMDYFGVMLSSAFLIFLLIPLNSGGVFYSWNSAIIIVFFVLSGVFLFGFIAVESYVARIPIIPLSLFNNVHVMNLLFQCVLYGMVFFSICFYFPFYCLSIREFTAMATAGYMQCVLLPLALGSSITGRIISKIGNYNYVIWTGYTLWLIGSLALLSLRTDSNLYGIAIILIIISVGVSCTFQPTQQALQSHSLIEDRAVVMSTRNTLRYVGNAMGIAISSVIFSQTIIHQVLNSKILSESQKTYINDHITSKVRFSEVFEDPSVASHVSEIYMKAIKNLIYLWIPLIGVCWLLSFLVSDTGLRSKDEKAKETNNTIN